MKMKVRGQRKKRQVPDEGDYYYDYTSSYNYNPNVPIPKNSRDIKNKQKQYISNSNDKSHNLFPSSSDLKKYEYDGPEYGTIGPPPYYYPINNDTIHSTNNSTEVGHTLHVNPTEVVIVLLVLMLWVGAIALFFHRWGKIRMLEPYQPKFCEAEICPRSHSKMDLSPHFAKCNYHGIGSSGGGGGSGIGIGGLGLGTSGLATGILGYTMVESNNSIQCQSANNRPRQNSVFVTSIHSTGMAINGSILKNPSRKTKSALDLSNLILSEEFQENVRRNSKNSITQL